MELTEENLVIVLRTVIGESFTLIMKNMILATLLSLLVVGFIMKILEDHGYRVHFSISRFEEQSFNEDDASEDDTSQVNDASEVDTSQVNEVSEVDDEDDEEESATEEQSFQSKTLSAKEFMDVMVSPDTQHISFISPTSSTLPVLHPIPTSSHSSTPSTPSTSSPILMRDERSDELERKKFEEMCKKVSSVPPIQSNRIESHMPSASYMSLRSSVGGEETLVPTSSNVKVNVADIMKAYNLPEYQNEVQKPE